MNKIMINVTEENIGDWTNHRDPYRDCMVARVLKDALPHSQIGCGFQLCDIDEKFYELPGWVTDRIRDFMRDIPQTPFSFEPDLDAVYQG